MANNKPLGQQYHEAVEELKTGGTSNADAIREVAARFKKNENAIRGGINQYRNRSGDNTSTPRRRGSGATSVDQLVTSARRSIEEALVLIDREVDEAKSALDAAQTHYDTVAASVKERKADLTKKLSALS